MDRFHSHSEQERLGTCRFYSLLVAPAAPAVIAFSLIAGADKLEYHDRAVFDQFAFLGNWLLAPPLAGGLMFWLHPLPTGRWWKALLAAAYAVLAFWLCFAIVAFAGMIVGLDR
ncbi:MAG: hypothetical protein H0T47_22575 [Planctomycetaceae bacterium]|nr:hypothetical protein [Planctomycetaceae bacterium]